MPCIDLKVIAQVPTNFFHCMHCEQLFRQAGISEPVHDSVGGQYPEDFLQDALDLADWLHDLQQSHQKYLRIEVIDPQSIQGFYFSLRHWVRRYPAFIISHRKVYVGWDREALDRILHAYLPQAVAERSVQGRGG